MWPASLGQFSRFPPFGSRFPDLVTVNTIVYRQTFAEVIKALSVVEKFNKVLAMSLNDFLSQWLRNAAQICLDEVEGEEEKSEEETILVVGRSILSLHSQATIDDIHNEISVVYNVDGDLQEASIILEYLLVHAVSENCGKRADFVQDIMNMEPEAQMYLMQIIQDKLSAGDSNEADDVGDEESVVEFTVEDVHVPVVVHQREHHIDTCREAAGCSVCPDKDNHIKRLQHEIEQVVAKFREETCKLRDESGTASNKIVDLEYAVMEKDGIIFERDQELKEYHAQKEKFEIVFQKNVKLEEQVLVLQDEIDMLKPQAAKLDFAEAQVDRFRAKLDELNDIKQQLKVESSNHSETYDKLVLLEQEVDGLRKLKTQLEEYRAECAENTIAMQELQLRLQDKETEISSLLSENTALRGDQSEHRHQTQHLADELRTTAEQLRERERGNGIGEGMSELNPALMQELNRLKNENRDLLEKLDQTALATLETLRKDIADQQCMNGSLQKKWMNTKDSLAKAMADIQAMSYRLHDKECDLAALQGRFSEASNMASEDRFAAKRQHTAEVQFLQRSHTDLLTLTHTGHNTVVGVYSASLAEAHSSLEATQTALHEMTDLQEETAESLENVQEELQEAGRKRKHMETAHEEAVSKLNEDFACTLETHAKKHKSELAHLEQVLTEQIRAEKQRTADLQVDLEQEGMKRRAVERQKKFHELEAQRQRTQLQAAEQSGVGAGGEGVQVALQELKSMQEQLDAAKAEIHHLRTHASSSSDASAGVAGQRTDGVDEDSRASSQALKGAPVRCMRTRGAAVGGAAARLGTDHPGTEATFGSLSYSGFLEQSDYAEKRIEQLTREKREMLSKGLEETKEKHELAQKLLAMERDHTALKEKLRKFELDKERSERKLVKQIETLSAAANKENVRN